MEIKMQEELLMVKIQKSFFLLEPLDNLLVDLICINKDFSQEKLLLYTIHHHSIKKYPNKVDYTIRYLKQVISLLEYNSVEVLEIIYSEYVKFLNTKALDKQYYYRHFIIDEKLCVIKNTYSMISRGTTGLCVWEGAMVLAEWCFENKNMLTDKSVLELGCGVGLAGLVAIKHCNVKCYTFSDCNNEVLEILRHNVQINIKDGEILSVPTAPGSGTNDSEAIEVSNILSELVGEVSRCHISPSHEYVSNPKTEYNEPEKDFFFGIFENCSILIKNLSFEEISLLGSSDIVCDVVLASDIVYDSDLFPSLKNALINIFNHNKMCTAIFACKIRNMETFESFLKILNETQLFQVSEEKLESQNLIFFSDQKMYSMVKILMIKNTSVA